MQEINEERRIMRLFWTLNKKECLNIRSINEVYNKFCEYTKKENITSKPINKYIFRTYIRKNGYCNSHALK